MTGKASKAAIEAVGATTKCWAQNYGKINFEWFTDLCDDRQALSDAICAGDMEALMKWVLPVEVDPVLVEARAMHGLSFRGTTRDSILAGDFDHSGEILVIHARLTAFAERVRKGEG